jgi:hypothetical protein
VTGSWSPTRTSTAYCRSASTVRSAWRLRSATSFRPAWPCGVTGCTWPKPAPSPSCPRMARW